MDSLFKTLETSRKSYAALFDKYTMEQLNTIPPGYRNNIIWNIGHIIVAQQSLVYRLSNLPVQVSDEMVARFTMGTAPTNPVDEKECISLRELLFITVEQTRADFVSGKFQVFKEYTTQTGFHLQSLNDAFDFNNYHEGLHYGIIMSLRKFV